MRLVVSEIGKGVDVAWPVLSVTAMRTSPASTPVSRRARSLQSVAEKRQHAIGAPSASDDDEADDTESE